MQNRYDRSFYEAISQQSSPSVAEILPHVLELVQPKSIVDVGCGTGTWLAGFRAHGITDVLGLDGPWVDADLLQIPKEQFRVVDLAEPLKVDRKFDLVVSLEVAEHLPPAAAEGFVRSLTSLGSLILFSAAIPYQQGYQHLNEQWPSYWTALFAARGFRAIDCLRLKLWENRQVEWWYAQNMFFVVDPAHLERWPALAAAAQHAPAEPPSLVHPRLFLQSTAWAKRPKELFHATLGALRDQWLRRKR